VYGPSDAIATNLDFNEVRDCLILLLISCFIKIQIGLTFLVPTYPGKEAVKWASSKTLYTYT